MVMKMYKIAIIDDYISELNRIHKILTQYCQQEKLSIHIDIYCDTTQFPFDKEYDALFLDIVMPEIDGISLAKKILNYYEPLFIFITHKSDLVINTFSVHAYDFIPKKHLDNLLIPTFKDVINQLSKTHQKISFKTSEGTLCCSLDDIIYFEIHNHTLSIITQTKTYSGRATMRAVTSKVSHPSFVLVNQSTFINLDYVKYYQCPAIKMSNNHIIYASRKYQKTLKKRLNECYETLV